MKRRRSKLQREILNVLKVKKVRTQKEIADFLNKDPSSVNRSINLLIDEDLVRKNYNGYYLSSKYKQKLKPFELLKVNNELIASSEKLIKEINAVIREKIDYSLSKIFLAGKITEKPFMIMSDSINKLVSTYDSFLDSFLDSANKIHEVSSLFNKNLRLSKLMFSKILYLNSLPLSNKLNIKLNALSSGILNTTKYFKNYSLEKVNEILQKKESQIIHENLFKFRTSSLIYKNLSYSIPYPTEKDYPETIYLEEDFAVEVKKSKKLKKALFSIDPILNKIREGAWETLYSDNPDKCRQSATSMIEFLNWIIQKLAPNEEVMKYTKFDKKEQITRRKRIEYILKSLSDIKIINFFCKNVIDIFNILNKPKHTFKYTNEKNLESLFYMIEGIALFLIYCKS